MSKEHVHSAVLSLAICFSAVYCFLSWNGHGRCYFCCCLLFCFILSMWTDTRKPKFEYMHCIVLGRTQQKYVCPILAHWNRKYRNNKAQPFCSAPQRACIQNGFNILYHTQKVIFYHCGVWLMVGWLAGIPCRIQLFIATEQAPAFYVYFVVRCIRKSFAALSLVSCESGFFVEKVIYSAAIPYTTNFPFRPAMLESRVHNPFYFGQSIFRGKVSLRKRNYKVHVCLCLCTDLCTRSNMNSNPK